MGCVNADGTLTESGKQMLQAMEQPMSPEQVAEAAGQPLFKVRASLRQMLEAGLVALDGEKYQTTESGRLKVMS